jgi:hypothetical protein
MLKMEMKRRRQRDCSSLRMIDSVEKHCGYPCILIWLKEVTNHCIKVRRSRTQQPRRNDLE